MPPAQQADAADGEIGRRTEIANGLGARSPVAAHELHGTHLGLDGIAGAQLYEPQEPDRHGAGERQRDAAPLNCYLVSRHLELPERSPGDLRRRAAHHRLLVSRMSFQRNSRGGACRSTATTRPKLSSCMDA